MSRQLSWKTYFLSTRQILGILVNTLAADDEFPVLNKDNLMIPIQSQLSQKQRNFCQFLTAFLKYGLNFEYFEKQDDPNRFCISDITDSENSRSNMVNVPKHCWNLHHSILIKFTNQCQRNWVRKSLSYWHAESWDCLLTHWLPMTSVLFLIETI